MNEDRFWNKVIRIHPDDCWNWTGARFQQNYGKFWDGGRLERAHRVAYRIAFGAIPSGMYVCHRCDNPLCCNPDHLFPGTMADNMRDMVSKGRHIKGTRVPTAKLDGEMVRSIRVELESGVMQKDIASRYGVDRSTISNISTRKAWAHI